MKIAVDAMGGDHAPSATVQGALQAIEKYDDIEVLLVGKKEEITSLMPSSHSRVKVIHAEDVITSEDEPVRAVRRKRSSSLVRVTRMVKEKEADACISAGNTGAYMSAGLLIAGRIKGIERPALATMVPTTTGNPTLLLDVGANVDAKPTHLLQYAKMGSIYVSNMLHYDQPRVGLLNIGTEEAKGNELTKQTFPLLAAEGSIQFIGNVEARDIPDQKADVIVCDGFSGNVALKVMEGVGNAVMGMLKEEFTRNGLSKMAALILKPGLQRIRSKVDYSEYGGAPLLGVDGICIKVHGSSTSSSITHAIGQSRSLIEQDMIQLFKHEV